MHSVKIESIDCSWSSIFTDEEINQIHEYAATLPSEAGKIDGMSEEVETIRKSELKWINRNDKTLWIFHRIEAAASKLNSKFYGFDIEPTSAIQYTVYHDDHSHYDWHFDMFVGVDMTNLQTNRQRKLSAVVQLSDPSEYEGGELEVMTGNRGIFANKEKGTLTTFPSFALHRVLPVTSGTRASLVYWFTGPDWR